MNCPRCGAEVARQSRFCMNCGQPLSPVDAARPSAPAVPETERVQPGRSVLRALLPGHMPKGTFWAGLTLVFVGVIFALCTASTSVALLLGSGGGIEALLVSACGLAVLFLPGLIITCFNCSH